uniref:Nucleoside diphosphate kinase n=1 Tax=Grammatophora oceanica TaxID=210454 RepID=A0A7S1URR0_9STRA|eukprot:CAMPEP_0194028976 /NCGR_PEP_ID=MMETSP0009_2-20130614/2841_1 /TAXON_ID=210454 /ORGANISM="Grammatophora oceanica, Strain CCMP 410" /LENGTH=198 /DNA_ID=CAMNT_0038668529 /DNA_START=29 /DNA_END=625 /DNA_ORIENTATION=+
MKSFATVLLAALVAAATAFAPSSSFAGRAFVSKVSNGGALSMNAAERTYIMIKPDGVQRGIVGNIISRFESKGYKLVAMKTKIASAELLNEHYNELVEKPFFPGLRDYMSSGPVVCMCWEGKEAVSTGRKMLGATNPLASEPGTIRGDFCIEVGRNICHGSDSVENAERELGLWFEEGELLDWESHSKEWVYELDRSG